VDGLAAGEGEGCWARTGQAARAATMVRVAAISPHLHFRNECVVMA